MDGIVKAYHHDYKGSIISFLMVSGLWPDDSKQPKILRIILGILSLVMMLILLLGILNYIVHTRNVMSIIAGIGSMISFGSVFIKTIAMMLLWRNMKSLSGSLSTLFESDLKVPEYRVHLLVYYRKFYRFFKVYSYHLIGFVVFSTCVPVVAALRGSYVRTYAIRVPFDYVPGGPMHWLIFVFEITASSYTVINTIGVDMVFGLFALHMVGELRLLSHRFRNLKPGKTYRRDLKDCIDRHCLLIDNKYTMEKVFGFMSVWLALSCAVVVCTIIFRITQIKNLPIFKLIVAIDHTGAKLLQAYAYAWFGNAITLESERCSESIYYSKWTESGNVDLRKDVLIIQSQSPMYINAMGIIIVRLDMFIKIAHASISYFFLLKTIEEKLG